MVFMSTTNKLNPANVAADYPPGSLPPVFVTESGRQKAVEAGIALGPRGEVLLARDMNRARVIMRKYY